MSNEPTDQLQRRVRRQVVRSLFLTFVLVASAGTIGWSLHGIMHPYPVEKR